MILLLMLSFFDKRQLTLIESLNKNLHRLANDEKLLQKALAPKLDYSVPGRLFSLTGTSDKSLDVGVITLCVLPGDLVAVSGHDKTIKIFDLNTKDYFLIHHMNEYVHSMQLLTDGQLMCCSHTSIFIWNPATAECRERFAYNRTIGRAIELQDHRILFYSQHSLYIWDRNNKKDTIVEPVLVGSACDDGPLLQLKNGMIAYADNNIYDKICNVCIFDLTARTKVKTLTGLTFTVFSILELADNKLAATDGHGRLGIWNYHSGIRLSLSPRQTTHLPSAVVVDEAHIICGDGDAYLQIWNIENMTCQATVKMSKDSPVRAIAKLLDNRIIAGNDDGSIHVQAFAALMPEQNNEENAFVKPGRRV